jgi:hypothetical protein
MNRKQLFLSLSLFFICTKKPATFVTKCLKPEYHVVVYKESQLGEGKV